MDIYTKIKWFIGVLAVFLLILATNLIDKQNFMRVEQAVDNIYNERLIAKELLLDVTLKFHRKELAYVLNDSSYLQGQNDQVNLKITELMEMFERTEATRNEKITLEILSENHSKLIALESNLQPSDTLYSGDCRTLFLDINENLYELSVEQVKEGNREKHYARDAINSVKLFTKIEIYLLIILALIMQAIILFSPKKKETDN
jgi:hypothetical protein